MNKVNILTKVNGISFLVVQVLELIKLKKNLLKHKTYISKLRINTELTTMKAL